jgi:hypothetical protein
MIKSRRRSPKKKVKSLKLVKLVKIVKSPKKDKKYRAIFLKNGREKKVDFGAKGYQNYGGTGTERHLDKKRKQRYINRHRSRENWKDPTTAGSLSRYILWNKDTFRASVSDYKRKFNL